MAFLDAIGRRIRNAKTLSLRAVIASPRRAPLTPEDRAFKDFVASIIDRQAYWDDNPDVAAKRHDPLEHWLNYGLDEGRPLAPGVEILRGEEARSMRAPGWQSYTWRKKAVAICRRYVPEPIFSHVQEQVRHARRMYHRGWQSFTWRGKGIAIGRWSIPDAIISQIKDQVRHDPSIAAAGLKAIPRLREIDMDNLMQRGGIDVARLFASIPRRPSAVFIVPWLVTGGAEKYMADIVGALRQASHEVLVIVTLPKAKSAPDWSKLGILAPLREANILFWSDVCRSSSEPYILARLLNALRPQLIFVVNSELGYEVIANFGRGLASLARLFCTFFALGEIGLSDVRYGMYYPRHTLRFAKAVTDDLPTVNRLQALYGKIPGPGIAMLPPRLSIVHEKTFNDRLAARKRFAGNHPRRWAWVGRLTLMKGTAVLAALAGVRPEDRFEIFGSLEGSLESLEIRKPNILYRGCLDNVLEADFREYHGYVYTSLFDGMPNVVLEMSQHAIPLVLADIGGLRDTFDDDSVIFVKQTHSDPKETALAFDEALNRLAQLSEAHVDHMILKAYRQVRMRHSPETYTRILSEIIA